MSTAEKPPRIPPLALVRAINTVRAGAQRLSRVLAPGGVNILELLTGLSAWLYGQRQADPRRAIAGFLFKRGLFLVVLELTLVNFAWTFQWHHDHWNPDGSVSVGYETVVLNINVVLLFVVSILAAYRSGASWRGTVLFALMNAALGWIIVTVELALE